MDSSDLLQDRPHPAISAGGSSGVADRQPDEHERRVVLALKGIVQPCAALKLLERLRTILPTPASSASGRDQ
jgi:hypothetical protein